MELHKDVVTFNKPIYVGFSVLELSKYHMYKFHYDVMKKHYKDRLVTLYLDTDSFFYQIFTKDLYDDFLDQRLNTYLDLSGYPPSHKCFSTANKKAVGKFKDVCSGVVVVEFAGLRPKLYIFKTTDDAYLQDTEKLAMCKSKGISKYVVKNQITFEDYKRCLFSGKIIRKDNRYFRTKKHAVQTVTVNKIALSPNDDKRYICENKISTLAYGHYRLADLEDNENLSE